MLSRRELIRLLEAMRGDATVRVMHRACWDRVRVAYEPNTQNNPAERPATNARTPAAGNAKRREMNYVCENRRSGLGAALGLYASRFLHPRSQIDP